VKDHGTHKIIFTVQQELAIVDEIRVEYDCNNWLFTSVKFLTIVHRRPQKCGIRLDRVNFTWLYQRFQVWRQLSSPRFKLDRRDRSNNSRDTTECIGRIRLLPFSVDGKRIANVILTWVRLDAHEVSIELTASRKETINFFSI
jgi:hypothetical protein